MNIPVEFRGLRENATMLDATPTMPFSIGCVAQHAARYVGHDGLAHAIARALCGYNNALLAGEKTATQLKDLQRRIGYVCKLLEYRSAT